MSYGDSIIYIHAYGSNFVKVSKASCNGYLVSLFQSMSYLVL
uniref:Uncharacterized protein n=1 Tax=Lepeophtheirus salmonis TaxID=72036 RepID=A0A0K2SVE7_LEPSM